MRHFFEHAAQLLRGGPWAIEAERPHRALALLLSYLTLSGMLYGGVMGSFDISLGERLRQVLYAAVKVPLLLLLTFLLGLPSFFVLHALFGLREDFGRAVRALVATQAALAIVLASLAPFTAVWYFSSDDYERTLIFNALMFAIASITAQVLLRRFYLKLIERDRRHRWMLRSWIVVYVLVGIQMAWILRPFVGAPGVEVQFFREDTWGNAYLLVGEKLWRALRR